MKRGLKKKMSREFSAFEHSEKRCFPVFDHRIMNTNAPDF